MCDGQEQKANRSVSADESEAKREVKCAGCDAEVIFKAVVLKSTNPFNLLWIKIQ